MSEDLTPDERGFVDLIETTLGPDRVTQWLLLTFRETAAEIERVGYIDRARFKEIERAMFTDVQVRAKHPADLSKRTAIPGARPN